MRGLSRNEPYEVPVSRRITMAQGYWEHSCRPEQEDHGGNKTRGQQLPFLSDD